MGQFRNAIFQDVNAGKCCKHLSEKGNLNTVKINDKDHISRNGGNCKTTNAIYGMRCKECNQWYIGETGMRLHDRLSGHRASIKRLEKGESLNTQLNDTGLAEHFLVDGHNFERDAELHLLEAED